jgi:hypothetical protein
LGAAVTLAGDGARGRVQPSQQGFPLGLDLGRREWPRLPQGLGFPLRQLQQVMAYPEMLSERIGNRIVMHVHYYAEKSLKIAPQ